MFKNIRAWMMSVIRINKVYIIKIDDGHKFNNVFVMYDKEEAIDLLNSINTSTTTTGRAMITAEIL
mgnify:FL=1|jgi:hypothetical protein